MVYWEVKPRCHGERQTHYKSANVAFHSRTHSGTAQYLAHQHMPKQFDYDDTSSTRQEIHSLLHMQTLQVQLPLEINLFHSSHSMAKSFLNDRKNHNYDWPIPVK